MIENTIANIWQFGWTGRTSLVLYAAPIALWGLGATEGIIRATFNGLGSWFARVNNKQEESQRYWDRCKKDGGIAMSCTAITGISLVPVVGTYWGLSEFSEQCGKYAKIKHALLQNNKEDYLGNLDYLLEKLDKIPQVTEEALNQLCKDLDNPVIAKKALEKRLNLPNSLIHNYYGYSITYITLEKTTAALQFTARKIKDVVIFLSKKDILKKIATCGFNAISQEVQQTLEDTVHNRRERKKIA